MRSPNNIRVLINPNSGLGVSMRILMETFMEAWDCDGRWLSFQLSKSAEDGQEKARRAVAEGVDTLIVVGGDGMINTIGQVLVNTDVMLGVIPTGSGNGFARHFGIPLLPSEAIRTLVSAVPQRIDVGRANGHLFFVTCSMAWDAALVRTFEKSPVRGILPYVFAAAYELFDYKPVDFEIQLDGNKPESLEKPMLFTVANLTQFGGGAQIAPRAKADDGRLWLTTALNRDVAKLIPFLPKLFDGTLDQSPHLSIRSFKHLRVRRPGPQSIQVDGELIESDAEVIVDILPSALTVLAPSPHAD